MEWLDTDVIDICTPGDTHAQIAIAALDVGKHRLGFTGAPPERMSEERIAGSVPAQPAGGSPRRHRH